MLQLFEAGIAGQPSSTNPSWLVFNEDRAIGLEPCRAARIRARTIHSAPRRVQQGRL